jgi:nucleoside-diphosphate-sugar epimerase
MNKHYYVVTGAAGFLGSLLINKLLQSNCPVIGIDKHGVGFIAKHDRENPLFTFYKKDITKNGCLDFLNKKEITGIFHLAARQPSSVNLSYDDFYQGNVLSTKNIINLAKKVKPDFFIYTSTIALVKNEGRQAVINENSMEFPENYYCLTKYVAEKMVKFELRDTQTKAIIVRFPSLFGKNHLGGLVYTYYQLAKANKDIEVYGKGISRRNLLYGSDAAGFLLRIAQKTNKLRSYEVFILGSKDSLPMKEIALTVKNGIGSSSKIILSGKKNSVNQDIILDSKKAKQLFKFKLYTIKERLKLYCEDMHEKV